MFEKILGYLWICLGALFVLKPAFLRGWFARRTNRKLFFALLFLFIAVFLQLLGIVLRFEGALPKAAGIIGIILLLRAGWGIQSKARGHVSEWFGSLPLWPFQAFGSYLIALGVSLVYFA